jgi:hypothetical protein
VLSIRPFFIVTGTGMRYFDALLFNGSTFQWQLHQNNGGA